MPFLLSQSRPLVLSPLFSVVWLNLSIVFAEVDAYEMEGREMPPNVIGLWIGSMFNLR